MASRRPLVAVGSSYRSVSGRPLQQAGHVCLGGDGNGCDIRNVHTPWLGGVELDFVHVLEGRVVVGGGGGGGEEVPNSLIVNLKE